METPGIKGLKEGVANLLTALPYGLCPPEHIKNTPTRFETAMFELMEGAWEDPAEVLHSGFEETEYDEMIYVNNISFVSLCSHHLLPFIGRVHFAYIPTGKIVGLSKIPRMIEILAKRPQVQERLTVQIVDTFMKEVHPKGCAAVAEAYHMCMAIRGVKKEGAYMKTTALRGVFKSQKETRAEFLDGIKSGRTLWP